MIKVKNEVNVYEIDGDKVDSYANKIAVVSHWNGNDLVVISTGSTLFTVSARDMKAAIENATNVNRY